MSPLIPLELNMVSWEPVVNDSMAFLSWHELNAQIRPILTAHSNFIKEQPTFWVYDVQASP